jgi:hypothetical protein
MATLSKTLTTSSKMVSIADGQLRGSVSFVDEKGNQAGQCTVTIKDGKVAETGQDVSPTLLSAVNTVSNEFSALVESLVKAGSLDPMNRGRKPNQG